MPANDVERGVQHIFTDRDSKWILGAGTKNPRGDYYYKGEYVEPALPNLVDPSAVFTELYRRFNGTNYQCITLEDFIDEGL